MNYRSILVHLDGSSRCAERVAVASRLASAHGSHLIGLAPTGWIDMPGTVSVALGGPASIQLSIEYLEKHAQSVVDQFAARMRACEVIPWEAGVYHGDPLPGMVQHARASDLVVIGQTDPEARDSAVPADFPQRLILQAGRPVLVIPYAGRFDSVGQNVLVAWNGSREGVRALADALPLLSQARAVRLQYFEEPNSGAQTNPGMEPACAWLARHGVVAQAGHEVGTIDPGEALLSRAADLGADLIVMGAYGHSRLSEFLMGGATRTLLAQMTVPVLMSH